jgi:hypothetical protein
MVHLPAWCQRLLAGAWPALALAFLAVLTAAIYLAIWPVGYGLTHGPQFSYQYLVQYPSIWDVQVVLLLRFFALFPPEEQTLEQVVGLLLVIFALAFAAYLLAFAVVRRARRGGRLLLALVVLGTLAFQTVLFLMPPVFTTDLFSYVAYSQIASVYELNPYIHLPRYFGSLPVLGWIAEVWRDAPSVYGPVWVSIAQLVGFLTEGLSVVDRVLAHRLLANLFHLVNLALFWLLLGRYAPTSGNRPDAAGTAVTPGRVAHFLLFAWNPLLLFEFAGNGHNDVMMLTFLLAALLFLPGEEAEERPARGRFGGLGALAGRLPAFVAGVVALTCSALVKYTTGLLFPLYLALWARRAARLGGRLAVFALGGLIALAVAALCYAPWYRGPETFEPIVSWSKGPQYSNHPPDLIAHAVASLSAPKGPEREELLEAARDVLKVLERALLVLLVGLQAWRVRARRDLLAGGIVLLLVFLLAVHTWVLPWYFTWPLALALLLGWDHVLAKLLIGLSFTAPTMMYAQHYLGYLGEHAPLALYLHYLSPLLALLPHGVARLQSAARTVGAERPPSTPLPSPRPLESGLDG